MALNHLSTGSGLPTRFVGEGPRPEHAFFSGKRVCGVGPEARGGRGGFEPRLRGRLAWRRERRGPSEAALRRRSVLDPGGAGTGPGGFRRSDLRRRPRRSCGAELLQTQAWRRAGRAGQGHGQGLDPGEGRRQGAPQPRPGPPWQDPPPLPAAALGRGQRLPLCDGHRGRRRRRPAEGPGSGSGRAAARQAEDPEGFDQPGPG